MEIWKDIVGYEGLYQVSDLGNVKSLERIRYKKNGHICVHKEKLRKPGKCTNGYLGIGLTNSDGVLKQHLVHRLVLSSFVTQPSNGYEVNHINSIRHDNRLVNLEWCTKSENNRHSRIYGNAKYCYVQVPTITINLTSGYVEFYEATQHVTQRYNKSKSWITNIRRRGDSPFEYKGVLIF